MYLPQEQQETVARSMDQGETGKMWNRYYVQKHTHLDAVSSHLTIQGSPPVVCAPYDTTAQILGAAKKGETMRAFSASYLSEQVAKDPQGWANFSFWMGMSPSAGTPAEFRTGLLEALPGIGPKLGEWNDNVMSV